MTIAVISHPDCLRHEAGFGHPEQPDRVKVVELALKQYPFNVPVTWHESPLATREQLIAVHDEGYVDGLFAAAPTAGFVCLDQDTLMNNYTLVAALRAAGSAPYAVDLVMAGQAGAAFCNIRPPGHHAEKSQAMGFCFFNNVAVGAAYALGKYQLSRVAIIDFDVHHGNGTQAIFQEEERVLYCSSFEHPFYPGYDPLLDNEHILSVPLHAGTGSEAFRQQVESVWFERLKAFQPQMIFFSAGFDAHRDDPLADLQLTKADYTWLTKKVAEIARDCCEGKMISVLEGGYNLNVLAECVPAHVQAMI